MAKLVSLLIALALILTNGPAVAAAVCQHVDVRAHVLALESADSDIAATAHEEEAAAAAASQKNSLADAGAVQLAGFLMPPAPRLHIPLTAEPLSVAADRPLRLDGRTVSPLLQPPLA